MAKLDRTSVSTLNIEGYRSIERVRLTNIPDAVVFYGQNGSGKSNVLRAVELGCRALDCRFRASEVDADLAAPITLDAERAFNELGLKSEDFHRPAATRIRIEMSWVLSRGVLRRLKAPGWLSAANQMSFDFGVVLEEGALGAIALSVERAKFLIQLGGHETLVKDLGRQHDKVLHAALPSESVEYEKLQKERVPGEEERWDTLRRLLADSMSDWARLELRLVSEFLAGWSVSKSDAYRAPTTKHAEIELSGGARAGASSASHSRAGARTHSVSRSRTSGAGTVDIEQQLHERMLSPGPEASLAIDRLRRLLGRAQLFGAERMPEFRPVIIDGEARVQLKHPSAGELPLAYFGTGEQQIFLLLAKAVLDSSPIVQIEEPEAHLHTVLMRPLADLLRTALESEREGADAAIDQLWLATHHHLFAISDEFYEVRLENGATVVERKNRAQAATHFYEPGALWDALRALLKNGLDREAVIFRTTEGKPVTAREIEESESGDRVLFSQWVTRATEQVVLSMKVRAEKDGT